MNKVLFLLLLLLLLLSPYQSGDGNNAQNVVQRMVHDRAVQNRKDHTTRD